MRRILFVILAILFLLPAVALASGGDDTDVRLFARYEPARETLTEGDSLQVNVVLYSNCPFQRAECTTKNIKIKGGHSRLLPRRGDRQQQRVRLAEGIFYAILWDTYVVGNDRTGSIKFPALQFDCEVEVTDEVYNEPFDPFGFFSRPRHKTHKVKTQCKCPAFELPVTERPKRSTLEVISSGGKVA